MVYFKFGARNNHLSEAGAQVRLLVVPQGVVCAHHQYLGRRQPTVVRFSAERQDPKIGRPVKISHAVADLKPLALVTQHVAVLKHTPMINEALAPDRNTRSGLQCSLEFTNRRLQGTVQLEVDEKTVPQQKKSGIVGGLFQEILTFRGTSSSCVVLGSVLTFKLIKSVELSGASEAAMLQGLPSRLRSFC